MLNFLTFCPPTFRFVPELFGDGGQTDPNYFGLYISITDFTILYMWKYDECTARAPPEIFPEGGQPPFLAIFGQGGGGQLEFFGGFNGQNERILRAGGGGMHGPPCQCLAPPVHQVPKSVKV